MKSSTAARLLLLVTGLLGLVTLTCQSANRPKIAWARRFRDVINPSYGQASCMQAAPDGGYVLASTENADDASFPMLMIKTNADGEEQWRQRYGSPDSSLELPIIMGLAAQGTGDGGYVMLGTIEWSEFGGVPRNGAGLVKTDSSGITEWTRLSRDWGYANSIAQASGGGYAIGGSGESGAFILRTDPQGDSLWATTSSVGGAYNETGPLQLVSDGGFVLPFTAQSGSNDMHAALLKLTSDGTVSWLMDESSVHSCRGVCETPDEGFMLVGQDSGPQPALGEGWFSLVCTDAQGEAKRVMHVRAGDGRAIDLMPDGNRALAGSSRDHPCVVKADTLGYEIWSATWVEDRGTFTSVKATADGGIVAAGPLSNTPEILAVKFMPPDRE